MIKLVDSVSHIIHRFPLYFWFQNGFVFSTLCLPSLPNCQTYAFQVQCQVKKQQSYRDCLYSSHNCIKSIRAVLLWLNHDCDFVYVVWFPDFLPVFIFIVPKVFRKLFVKLTWSTGYIDQYTYLSTHLYVCLLPVCLFIYCFWIVLWHQHSGLF